MATLCEVEHSQVERLAAQQAATAGSSPDNVAQTGVTIDRAALGWPDKVKIYIHYVTSLTADKVLVIKSAIVQHSTLSNMGSPQTLATLETTGTTLETGALTAHADKKSYVVSLANANQYIRFNFTLDMDASGTDTCSWSVVGDFSVARQNR